MAGKDEEKKKRDKEAIKQLYTMRKQVGVNTGKIVKAVENVQANVEYQQAQFERFRAENVEKFNKFVDKDLAEEVRKAQARIGSRDDTNVVYVCQTLSGLYGFDNNSMKVKTIGSGKDKEVVIACNSGIAIGKGDEFYVAKSYKGAARLYEVKIDETYYSMHNQTKIKSVLLNNDNVGVVEKTLNSMKTEYAKMGFKSDFNKELEAAHGEASTYKTASPEDRKQMDAVLAARTSKTNMIGIGPMKAEVLRTQRN